MVSTEFAKKGKTINLIHQASQLKRKAVIPYNLQHSMISKVYSHPIYLGFLFLFLVNDFYLKAYYPGIISGKLSDFTGLFVLAIFIYGLKPSFFKSFPRKIILLTFSGLILVLLQVTKILEYLNFILLKFSFPPHTLTADPTDIIALLILPFAYHFLKYFEQNRDQVKPLFSLRYVSIVVSFFALSATSFIGSGSLLVENEPINFSNREKLLFNLQEELHNSEITVISSYIVGDTSFVCNIIIDDNFWSFDRRDSTYHMYRNVLNGELVFKINNEYNTLILYKFSYVARNQNLPDSTLRRLVDSRIKPAIDNL